MILYQYKCWSGCGDFEAFSTIPDREEATCPVCNAVGQRVNTPIRFDDTGMGMDPDFPKAWDKWGKAARNRMTGQTRDSNNQRLTSDPTGRDD